MLTVTLSRRNLLTLLHKLQMPGSARTIIKSADDDTRVCIQAATDAEVYADRDPGPMHPDTEAFIASFEASGR